MPTEQINSTNTAVQNVYQMAQTKGTEDAERTNTERAETEVANTTPTRADRVEISREGLALAQQNNEEQQDQTAD